MPLLCLSVALAAMSSLLVPCWIQTSYWGCQWLDDVFVPPVPAPRLQGPRRNYFLFGEPIPTAGIDHKDRAGCTEVYSKLRSTVEDGIEYLLSAREEDPFEDMPGRYAWEQVTGVQAPSFDLTGKFGRFKAGEASK